MDKVVDMEKILKRCVATLDDDRPKKEIPAKMWNKCKGVAIINITEFGFIFTNNSGDGVVIQHNDDGTWGAPAAIEFHGTSGGAIVGAANKRVVIFCMTKYGLHNLASNKKMQLGAQMGYANGPRGRECNVSMEAGDKGANLAYYYMFEEGKDGSVWINIGISGNYISAAHDANKEFYGTEASNIDIVTKPDAVEIPEGKGYEELVAKLNELSGN